MKLSPFFARIFILLVIFGGVFGVAGKTEAATYYVDYENGSDTSDGMSTSAAWKHCPGDTNASQSPAIALQPGDEIIFKGGVEYSGQINVDWSGYSGSPITYDGNSANIWGSGKAILDTNNNGTAQAFLISGNSYINIENFEIREYADNEKYLRGGTGIKIEGLSNNINVRNCYIHSFGGWYLPESIDYAATDSCAYGACNDTDYPDATYIQQVGTGISIKASVGLKISNIMIEDCEFTRLGGSGIVVYGYTGEIDNVEIKNCAIHDYINWGIDLPTTSSGGMLKNISIHDSEIYNLFWYSGYYLTGVCTHAEATSSELEEHAETIGDNPHQNGIFIRSPNANVHTLENIRIYNNKFYNKDYPDCEAYSSGGGTTASGVWSSLSYLGDTIYIYNNIFHDIKPANAMLRTGWYRGATIKIYHNTFYLHGGNAYDGTLYLTPETPIETNYLRNNLFVSADDTSNLTYQIGPSCVEGDSENWRTAYSTDYNVHRLRNSIGDYGDILRGVKCFISGVSTLSDLQSATSEDQNSSFTTQNISDIFIDALNSKLDSKDFHLKFGSDAINTVVVLDDVDYPGSDYDADGSYRGIIGAVADAGAYEYVEAGDITPPSNPSGLSIY